MSIHELVRPRKTVDTRRHHQRHRLSARQLRARLREQRRAERLRTETRAVRE